MNYYLPALISVFLTYYSLGQQNTVSSGGTATGTGGTITYSVGQIDYVSGAGANGNINQGVQQPFEFFELNEVSDLEGSYALHLGPNPTDDIITLTVQDNGPEQISSQLYDMNGKLILDLGVMVAKNEIDLSSLSEGSYLLQLKSGDGKFKTFKIIKK